MTFLRLLLPELLPSDVQKVLYLDGDMVIRKNIADLWGTDIQDYPLAAVTEWDRKACMASSPAGIRRYEELGMLPEQPLFNAGVLLLNLEYWRQTRLAQRAFNYIREVGADVRWYEQEALNVVTNGRYRELKPHWNVPASSVAQLPDDKVSIVHYLTASKPWHWYHDPALATLFFRALDRTQWAGWRPARPPHGAVKLWGSRLAKALRKRLYKAQRISRRLNSEIHYSRAMPKRSGLGTDDLPPSTAGCEIRLFLTAPSVDADLLQTLTAWFDAGVERAFVLIDSATNEAAAIPDRYASFVHVFTCRVDATAHALRRLLHCYGASHWCVLGRLGEEIVDSAG